MNISKKVLSYIIILTVVAIFLSAYIAYNYALPNIFTILFWIALAAVSESLVIVIPSGIGLSVSFAVALATIIIYGPFLAIIVSASSFLLCLNDFKNFGLYIFKTPIYKTLFNISGLIISAGIASLAFLHSGGAIGQFNLFPTILSILIYALINTVLFSVLMVLLHNRKSIFYTWKNNYLGVFLNLFSIGLIGIILALAYMSYGAGVVVLFVGPLLIARYYFKLYLNIKSTYMDTISALNKLLEARDTYTSGHASRVQKYAEMLGNHIKLSDEKIENIKIAALLHDIGKVGISDSILKKPFSLSVDEYEEIKKHASLGAEIIEGVDFLKEIAVIVEQHHERYDGTGYPKGLKGNEILTEAAILAIADVYDAITTERPYRHALTKEEAIKELEKNAGTQFEPDLTHSFLQILENKENQMEELNPMLIEAASSK
ncbi:MAG: HD domain-containing protein [Clostridiales bacterium]|nr:HD domain-containing protein [Clostridiales bacterium]